jgi:hypothetical protein
VNYLPLFLVSAAAVGLETALTRYFAVASWSDYGYWVISIVMVGFAASGVLLALTRDFLRARADILFALLPGFLIASAAIGYAAVILNPFNPLQLQNPVTYLPQLGNIGLYYAALLPFFFAAGLFISLSFVTATAGLGRVYAADLAGAGAGSVFVLALMYLAPPFRLVVFLLPLLALSAWFIPRHRLAAGLAALVLLAAGEWLVLAGPQAAISPYKPIYPPAHTPGARVLATRLSPRGDFVLMDDFTERVNTDISNDAAMLGYPDPPRSYGLYRDGIRIASLPRPSGHAPSFPSGYAKFFPSGYAPGALDAGPYQLLTHPHVLIVGASGGFRIAEALALGADHVTALEPEPVMYTALKHGLGPSPAFPASEAVTLSPLGPRAALTGSSRYDLIDISADFLDETPANVYALSAQAMATDLAHLAPGGILSLPVSIQDFPSYALRMLATARAALALTGITAPGPHVIVYRSAWNARILLSPAGFTPAAATKIAAWADARSFDVSYVQGFDPVAARANLYNDLPAVSFTDGTVTANGPDDSIADEAAAVLAGRPSVSATAFDLRPVTDDRPAFYATLRLNQLSLLFSRLQILPQAEIGALVNLAVLAQAALIALLVLLAPLAAPRRAPGPRTAAVPFWRASLYVSALALGFLFIEIYAIERASLYLDDRAAGFSIVLSSMLIFSGLGSLISSRFTAAGGQAVMVAAAIVLVWSLALGWVLTPAVFATAGWPLPIRIALVIAVMAPVSIAMGLPFPLGLAKMDQSFQLAWAWGLNGAFSVVATPLANLTMRNLGLSAVLGFAVLMYGLAATNFPEFRRERVWLTSMKRSAAAD